MTGLVKLNWIRSQSLMFDGFFYFFFLNNTRGFSGWTVLKNRLTNEAIFLGSYWICWAVHCTYIGPRDILYLVRNYCIFGWFYTRGTDRRAIALHRVILRFMKDHPEHFRQRELYFWYDVVFPFHMDEWQPVSRC